MLALRVTVHLRELWKCCLSSTPRAGHTHQPASRRPEGACSPCCPPQTSEADAVDAVDAVLMEQCDDGDAPSPHMGYHITGCHLRSRTCCWSCCAASLHSKNRGQQRDFSRMRIIHRQISNVFIFNTVEVKRRRKNNDYETLVVLKGVHGQILLQYPWEFQKLLLQYCWVGLIVLILFISFFP